ncbi:YeeE/YedE family protein [Piscinibacter sakaiensis]|uniref:Putative transmembrane protein n=1 Tax=Piscinibacter sakaiensis TaxID=1547922 RepID=A0A0K8P661_PISS1|nr:YeeE/YedE [Piscinibacter sakaiensis]GAP38092.1 putative transmembrane protein [Piscinibacter sakaiensis]
MTLDWNAFTPGASLAGGLLIGAAAVLLVLGTGRIAGIAGILGTAWQALRAGRPLHGQGPRWAFLGGLVAAPWLWSLFAPAPVGAPVVGAGLLVAAGLLVGVGVRMGNGCTSGHGVCGLSRGSWRSLANVLAFMGSGVATVALLRLIGAA